MNKIYQKFPPVVKNAGFTLIELLVVVLIIGILAAAALPQYQLAVAKSRYSTMMAAVKNLRQQVEIYYIANGKCPADFEEMGAELPSGYELDEQLNVARAKDMYVHYLAGDNCGVVVGILLKACGPNGTGYGVSAGETSCWATPDNDFGQKLCKSLTGKTEGNNNGTWVIYTF